MTVVDLRLAGQSIIVTGGSSGIGFAAAQLLLDEGALVTICGRSLVRLDEAAAHLDSPNLHTVQADVLDSHSAARAVEEAVVHGGRLDGVAAVAGRGHHGSLLEMETSDVIAEVADKLLGFLNITRPAISHLAVNGGSIVGLTAPTARQPRPAMGAVGVGRAALSNAIDVLAVELAPHAIRANGVGVGLIDTPLQTARHSRTEPEVPYPQWLQRQAEDRNLPLARPGTPTEVAAAICWLLSPVSSYTTGSVLDVTGGHRSR